MKSFIIRFFILISIWTTPMVFAQNSFQGVGDLAGGKFESWVWDVSGNGEVAVGHSYYSYDGAGFYQAFRWTESTGMVGIGFVEGGYLSVAEAVSENGTAIAGYSVSTEFDQGEAFRWIDPGPMVGLGGIPGTQVTSSVAYGVAADGGLVVGRSTSNYQNTEAFFWLFPFGMTGLGYFPDGDVSYAEDICYRGEDAVIVGWSNHTDGTAEAYYFITPGPMNGMDYLSGYSSSKAISISGDGNVIVGFCGKEIGVGIGKVQAFRYVLPNGPMEALGELDIDGSAASDVSGDGSIIVGVSGGGPFIWDATNGMRDLRNVMENEYDLDLTGWILIDAQAISDDGKTIVGNGINPAGNKEGWIAKLASKSWIKVVAPNGGEVLQANSQYEIKWTSSGFIPPTNVVNILYSTTGYEPYTWGIIAQNIADNGSYMWTVPNTYSTNCVILIANAYNGEIKDYSDQPFTITPAEGITIIDPNGGETWYVGSTHQIYWSNTNFQDNVKIEYSTNGGSSYQTIVTDLLNNGTYDWDVPNDPSSHCRVRVSDAADGVPSDESDADFSIFAASLELITPNGGENWQVGTTQDITWNSVNIGDRDITIEYSTDNGNNYQFENFCTNTVGTTSYTWQVPNVPSTQCYIRISVDVPPLIIEESDSPFSISTAGNTQTGNDVTVNIGNGVTVNFKNVTGSGNTTLDIKTSGPPPPSGFKLGPSALPVYYDINTDASFEGNITICIPYDDTGLTPAEENNLKLYVFETPPGDWIDITSSLDTDGNIICGTVTHLTYFAILLGPTHFTFTFNTEESYSIVIDNASLDGIPLETGDEIGVFTSAGLCVGASVWDGNVPLPLTAWADDSQTPEVDGYNSGEQMFFRVWDASAGTSDDYAAKATYSIGNGNFGFGAYARVSLLEAVTSITQNVALRQGWSWISFNVEPSDLLMENVMSSVSNLAIVVNGAGQFYIPSVINSIGQLSILEGYKVYLNAVDQISLTGKPVPSTTPIPLKSGWNFISYLPCAPIAVETALSPILSELVIVKNDDGEFYIPNVINSLGDMEPGEGYKLYMSSDVNLVYPSNSGAAKTNISTPAIQNWNPKHFSFKARTGDCYCVVIESPNVDNKTFTIGNEIGVFTDAGICVGAGVWDGTGVLGIATWADDDRTEKIDGFKSGEKMIFKMWDKNNQKESAMTATYITGNGRFGEDAFSIVNLECAAVPANFSLKQNYPNPFNSMTVITYQLPHTERVELKIYSLLGEEIKTLVNETKDPGLYKVMWDARDQSGNLVSSGIYVYQLTVGSYSEIKKALFVK